MLTLKDRLPEIAGPSRSVRRNAARPARDDQPAREGGERQIDRRRRARYSESRRSAAARSKSCAARSPLPRDRQEGVRHARVGDAGRLPGRLRVRRNRDARDGRDRCCPAFTPRRRSTRACSAKLGIEADFIHIGDYKGAAEPITRENFSEPVRENMTSLIDSLYDDMVTTIVKDRPLSIAQAKEVIDTGLITAKQGQGAGPDRPRRLSRYAPQGAGQDVRRRAARAT